MDSGLLSAVCRFSSRLALLTGYVLSVAALAGTAHASDAVVSAYSNSQGSFTILGNGFNHIVEADIYLTYTSENGAPAVVTAPFLDRKNSRISSNGGGGALAIKLSCLGTPCKRTFSGFTPIALVDFTGSVSSMTAVLRHASGTTEAARISITNPTSEQVKERKAAETAAEEARQALLRAEKERLEAEKARQEQDAAQASGSSNQTDSSSAVSRAGTISTTTAPSDESRRPSESRTGNSAEQPAPHGRVIQGRAPRDQGDSEDKPISFSQRESVLERFRTFGGELRGAKLQQLFERSDDMFSQNPPVALSDGATIVRLTVRIPAGVEKAPIFYISEATCLELKSGNNDGVWVLELLPNRGSLHAAVTVLSGREMIDYPLTVAPQVEFYDGRNGGAGEKEYVEEVNRLAARGKNDSRN